MLKMPQVCLRDLLCIAVSKVISPFHQLHNSQPHQSDNDSRLLTIGSMTSSLGLRVMARACETQIMSPTEAHPFL